MGRAARLNENARRAAAGELGPKPKPDGRFAFRTRRGYAGALGWAKLYLRLRTDAEERRDAEATVERTLLPSTEGAPTHFVDGEGCG